MICMSFAACSSSSDESDDKSEEIPIENQIDPNAEITYMPESNGIFFEEEVEDAELNMVASDVSAYVGTWEATSDQALYFYGNIDLTVNSDGTWTGNFTEEDFEGTWEDMGDHLHMESTRLLKFDLAFEDSGKLILIETGDDYVLKSVLTKK